MIPTLVLVVHCGQLFAQPSFYTSGTDEAYLPFAKIIKQLNNTDELPQQLKIIERAMQLGKAKENKDWCFEAQLKKAECYRRAEEQELFAAALVVAHQEYLNNEVYPYGEDTHPVLLHTYLDLCEKKSRDEQDYVSAIKYALEKADLLILPNELDPMFVEARDVVALYLRVLGLVKAGIGFERESIELYEGFHAAILVRTRKVKLALLHCENGEYDEAERILDKVNEEKLIQNTADNFAIARAKIAVHRGDTDGAIQILENRVAKQRLSNSELLLELMQTYAANSDWQKARTIYDDHLSEVFALLPQNPLESECLIVQARVLLATGEVDGGVKILRDLVEDSSVSHGPREEAFSRLAGYFESVGQYQQAYEIEQRRRAFVVQRLEFKSTAEAGIVETAVRKKQHQQRVVYATQKANLEEELRIAEQANSQLQLANEKQKTSTAYGGLAIVVFGVMATFIFLQRLIYERKQKANEKRANVKLTEVVERTSQELVREFEEKSVLEKEVERKRRDEAIGQLTGCVAHDFNNLLQVVLSANDVLSRRSDLAEKEAMLLEASSTSANAGASVVRQLMAYARKQKLTPEPLQLDSFFKSVSSLLRAAIDRKCSLAICNDQPGNVVMLDSSQLTTALINMLRNSVYAMPNGGRITIEATALKIAENEWVEGQPGEYVSIAVTDEGRGMSVQERTRAFEPFFSTKEPGEGAGLGLSSVYGFVKQSGGDIRISKVDGGGTRVEMVFPKSAEQPVSKKIAVRPRKPEHCKVLLVEDDSQVGATLEHLLQTLDYNTYLVKNATDAIVMLTGFYKFDLVITDNQIQGEMDGQELADWVCKKKPGVGVILISGGFATRPDTSHTRLQKPFSQDELFEAIYKEQLRLEESPEFHLDHKSKDGG